MAAEPAQWEAILNQTAPHSFSPYGQDTNWWLLQSSLDQMRKTMPHPAVFLVLGDMLAHNFPKMFRDVTHDTDLQHYRTFVLKTIQFLALQLRRRWPDTQILLTPGNDDDVCGDYTIEAGGPSWQIPQLPYASWQRPTSKPLPIGRRWAATRCSQPQFPG